jgi:hypothetical protein
MGDIPTSGTDRFKSFLIHNFETLLLFSGIEDKIKPALAAEWSTVRDWNPEQRYSPVGTQSGSDAEDMIVATRKILRVLIP